MAASVTRMKYMLPVPMAVIAGQVNAPSSKNTGIPNMPKLIVK